MTDSVERSHIPTAVTVKPVLTLIRAYADGDKQGFIQAAIKIARELELNGETELALYICAQFNLVSTFTTND